MEESRRDAGRSIFNYTLVKLAMRCNLDCSYCYWFRDKSVYERPALLTEAAENAYVEKLEQHLIRHGLSSFFILFHGGEPLLFGKARFGAFCQKLRGLEEKVGIRLKLAMTSNGVLIDKDWAELLKQYRVGITLSIDGPKEVHDRARVDFKGRGSFDQTLKALFLLRENGIEPGVLSVCNPDLEPRELCEFFIEELNLVAFDFLVPDANYQALPRSIAAYYKKLFDLWYNEYSPRGIQIRFLESISKGLLGVESHSESIGYGPTSTVTLLTDGSLEPLDVLRTAGYRFTGTRYNIQTHELQDVDQDPLWQEVLHATTFLHSECERCVYKFACGGGHIASRWSNENRYDNPSVYCADLKEIFGHVWNRMKTDLYVAAPDALIPFDIALQPQTAVAS